MKALVFGEIIWDVYPDEQVIGGAPFNFSAHLSHLGNETYLISAVGEDELGEGALYGEEARSQDRLYSKEPASYRSMYRYLGQRGSSLLQCPVRYRLR